MEAFIAFVLIFAVTFFLLLVATAAVLLLIKDIIKFIFAVAPIFLFVVFLVIVMLASKILNVPLGM